MTKPKANENGDGSLKKNGRPSSYTETKAAAIIAGILTGEAVTQVLKRNGMPSRPTLFRWLEDHEGFRNTYARAKEFALDLEAEEIKGIADGVVRGATHQEVARQRLRMEAREWRLTHMLPNKYGVQRHELTGGNGGPIQTEDITVVRNRIANRLAGIASRMGGNGAGRVPAGTNGGGPPGR